MNKWELDLMKKCLYIGVINTELNSELLEEAVHKEKAGVSLVLRQVLEENSYGIVSGIVSKELFEEMDMGEEDVWRLAWKNTQRLFPPKFVDMKSELEKLLGMVLPKEDTPMYFLTSKKEQYGGVYFLCEKILKKVYEKLGDNFYILPSSIHETIIMREKEVKQSVEELKLLVMDANKTTVSEKDVLSNNVYYYSEEKGLTVIA